MNDEFNPRYSSPYGHPFIESPNMEKLAERGTLFRSTYCASPLCMPARSALMFGQPVHRLQAYNNCLTSQTNEPDYGEILKEQGIHTVHFGKLDVIKDPARLGFSQMDGQGFRNPGDLNISRNPLSIRPVDTPKGGTRFSNYGPKDDNPYRRDSETFEKGIQWIRLQGTSLDQPWLLSINTSKPHFPMWTTTELWNKYARHADLPEYDETVNSAQHPYAEDLRKHFQTHYFTEEITRNLRRGYYAHITYVDRMLGRIMDSLEETGLSDNTVIIFTADHGEMLGKFGMWWKCSLFDDSVKVPLLIAGPGFNNQKDVSTPVDHFDLMATVFDIFEKNKPQTWPGTSLLDIDCDDLSHIAFSEYHGHGTRGSAYVVRQGPWKLHYYTQAENMLFHMIEDPEELSNVIESHPHIAAEREKALRSICDPEKEDRRAEEFIKGQLEDINLMKLNFRGGGHAVQV